MAINKKWICGILCWCCLLVAGAQDNPQGLYQKKGGDYLPLYSGVLEPGYLRAYVNNPYWPQEYTSGNVIYRNLEYRDVEMLIDTYRQCLLVLTNDRMRRIEVRREDVRRLEIGGMEYVWKSKEEGAPMSAYYGIIYQGKDVVCRLHYAKSPVKKIKDRQVVAEFNRREKLYLMRNGKWYELHGLSSYLKLYKPQKEKLRKYCNEQQLQLDSDEDWKRLASYCETFMK